MKAKISKIQRYFSIDVMIRNKSKNILKYGFEKCYLYP